MFAKVTIAGLGCVCHPDSRKHSALRYPCVDREEVAAMMTHAHHSTKSNYHSIPAYADLCKWPVSATLDILFSPFPINADSSYKRGNQTLSLCPVTTYSSNRDGRPDSDTSAQAVGPAAAQAWPQHRLQATRPHPTRQNTCCQGVIASRLTLLSARRHAAVRTDYRGISPNPQVVSSIRITYRIESAEVVGCRRFGESTGK